MNNLYDQNDSCRLCNSANLSLVLSLASTPPANSFIKKEALYKTQPYFPLDLFFCEDCTHVQLIHVVNPNVLFSDYVYVSGTSPSFVKHFKTYAEDILELYTPPKDGLVIDIGSNDGTLLKFFKNSGMTVLGIDPAIKIASKARANGIETITNFFNLELSKNILETKGKAYIITANNVFAHANNLSEIAKGIHKLLAPEGIFVFEVSYLLDVFNNTLFDTIYHEHLSYHSVKPLISFFKAHNLELIEAIRIPTHGGSLRGVVQKVNGPRKTGKSVFERLSEEKSAKIDQSKTLKKLPEKINFIKKELKALLTDIKSRNKSIAGFGAPAKATTLMHHFDLGSKFLDFIVDDSPLKQGLFTPGLHIPVLPTSYLYENKPDYTLILAWNFADPIIEGHYNYQKSGGKFIVPLPNIKIY